MIAQRQWRQTQLAEVRWIGTPHDICRGDPLLRQRDNLVHWSGSSPCRTSASYIGPKRPSRKSGRISTGKSASVSDACSRGRFEAFLVADRISEALLASKVPLRSLEAHMDGTCH